MDLSDPCWWTVKGLDFSWQLFALKSCHSLSTLPCKARTTGGDMKMGWTVRWQNSHNLQSKHVGSLKTEKIRQFFACPGTSITTMETWRLERKYTSRQRALAMRRQGADPAAGYQRKHCTQKTHSRIFCKTERAYFPHGCHALKSSFNIFREWHFRSRQEISKFWVWWLQILARLNRTQLLCRLRALCAAFKISQCWHHKNPYYT